MQAARREEATSFYHINLHSQHRTNMGERETWSLGGCTSSSDLGYWSAPLKAPNVRAFQSENPMVRQKHSLEVECYCGPSIMSGSAGSRTLYDFFCWFLC